MSGTREELCFMARLAQSSERYEDMTEYMKRVAAMGQELSLEERNLLSTAYKNSVGSRRQAMRQINREQESEGKSPESAAAIQGYRERVSAELSAICTDLLEILSTRLIPGVSDHEAKVFYLKMQGDYHRYLAEYATGDSKAQCTKDAHDAYMQAMAAASGSLAPTNPIRLGLALNFSVFYYEVYGASQDAIKLASGAYDEAHKLLKSKDLGGQDPKEVEDLLGLLRDNLNLWTGGNTMGSGEDGTAVEEL